MCSRSNISRWWDLVFYQSWSRRWSMGRCDTVRANKRVGLVMVPGGISGSQRVRTRGSCAAWSSLSLHVRRRGTHYSWTRVITKTINSFVFSYIIITFIIKIKIPSIIANFPSKRSQVVIIQTFVSIIVIPRMKSD